MNTLREAAQQALEALELAQTDVHWELHSPTRKFLRKAEKALRAALAEPVQEPVQEPVAWVDQDFLHEVKAEGGAMFVTLLNKDEGGMVPLYTAPPQRKPLTEGKPWVCACGVNLYIDADGKPRRKA